MASSIEDFPKPKSLRFLSANLLCSFQYSPSLIMMPTEPPLRAGSFHPRRFSLKGTMGGREETELSLGNRRNQIINSSKDTKML
jgi:hypothetical protein